MLGYYEDPRLPLWQCRTAGSTQATHRLSGRRRFLIYHGTGVRTSSLLRTENITLRDKNLQSREIAECMVYGKVAGKELVVTARIIPDYERIEEFHGEIPAEERYL